MTIYISLLEHWSMVIIVNPWAYIEPNSFNDIPCIIHMDSLPNVCTTIMNYFNLHKKSNILIYSDICIIRFTITMRFTNL